MIYFYDGKGGDQFNFNLTFKQMANSLDKIRKKMNILAFNEETNEVTKKKDNKNEMIIKKRNSDVNNNRFSFTKFNNSSKNRKSIIEGYLLNYNINSEKIFSSILKDRNNDQLNLMN